MTADGYATDQDRVSAEQAAENARLKAELAAEKDDHAGTWELLMWVRDALRAFGCRHRDGPHDGTPPMMYPEWVGCVVGRREDEIKRLSAENAELRAALAPFGRMAWYFAEELKHVGDDHPLNRYDFGSATLGDAKRAAELAGVPAARPLDPNEQEGE